MKFILLITLLAIAFSSNGDVTALSLSATFYNTTGKAADALCGLTVSASRYSIELFTHSELTYLAF